MTLLLLEALGALVLLLVLVWWTMFSGRPRGELRADPTPPPEGPASGVASHTVDELDR